MKRPFQHSNPLFVFLLLLAITLHADRRDFFITATPQDTNFLSVAFAHGTSVAVGERGALALRTNLGPWHITAIGTTNDLHKVIFAGHAFWACGASGLIYHSTDGLNWSSQRLARYGTFNDLIIHNSARLLVGNAGIILRQQPPNIPWHPANSLTTESLHTIAGTPSELFTAGQRDTRLLSLDFGQTWTNLPNSHPSTNSITYRAAKVVDGLCYLLSNLDSYPVDDHTLTEPDSILERGPTWTNLQFFGRTLPLARDFAVSSSNVVVVGKDFIAHTTRPFEWHDQNEPGRQFNSVVLGAETFVIVGNGILADLSRVIDQVGDDPVDIRLVIPPQNGQIQLVGPPGQYRLETSLQLATPWQLLHYFTSNGHDSVPIPTNHPQAFFRVVLESPSN